MGRPRRPSLTHQRIREFSRGTQLQNLLVHPNARLVHAKMALEQGRTQGGGLELNPFP